MRFEGEVVLIYYQDKPTVYARIESIETDIKKDWYHITLLLLTLPARRITWILRESYIDGDPFTMEDVPVRLEEVKKLPPREEPSASEPSGKKESGGKPGKVIPFRK
jgi:hypothetical protein